MPITNVLFQYDGEWKINEKRECVGWCHGLNSGYGAFNLDDSDATIQDLEEKVFVKCGLNRDEVELKFSYVITTHISKQILGPIYLSTANCLLAYLIFGEAHDRPLLHVEFVKKNQSCNDNNGFDLDFGLHDDGEGTIANVAPDEYVNDAPLSPPVAALNEKNDSEKDVNWDQSPESRLLCHESVDDNGRNFLCGTGSEHSNSLVDQCNLSIGQIFKSKENVKKELQKIAMDASFEIHVLKSTKTIYSVRCMDDKCSWRLRAAQTKSSFYFSIRTYCSKHTCDLANRKKTSRQASTAVIADMLVVDLIKLQSMPSPIAIKAMMQDKGVEITYYKAWKAKQLAGNLLRGDPDESFRLLPKYLYMVEKGNPGSVTHLESDSAGNFKYVFLSYSACISGFKNVRKVVSIDATSLQDKYSCFLLTATALDGNHQQYPIAWSVVDSHNLSSWTWFFQKLHELIPDDDELVFISDVHEDIINGLAFVYKQAHHGYCLGHLVQNIKALFKPRTEGIDLFMQTAEAYKQSDFDDLYSKMKNMYPKITTYLDEKIDREKWSRAHFHGARYNIMTTNGPESMIAKLQFALELPIVALLDAIQRLVTSWFCNHRIAAAACELQLTSWAESTLSSRFMESNKFAVSQLKDLEYRVTGIEHDAFVNLFDMTCTCRVFEIERLPCAHIIAVASQSSMNIYETCSQYYHSATWALVYKGVVYPVLSTKEWQIPNGTCLIDVLPPIAKPSRGRRKKNRTSSIEESKRRKKRPRI